MFENIVSRYRCESYWLINVEHITEGENKGPMTTIISTRGYVSHENQSFEIHLYIKS
jgi:hypothetical protein